jgi:hypothetical protein
MSLIFFLNFEKKDGKSLNGHNFQPIEPICKKPIEPFWKDLTVWISTKKSDALVGRV